MTIPRLTVDVPSFVFNRFQEEQFVNRLTTVDRATVITPIGRPDDVILHGDGTTIIGGRRYTTSALAQLCQLLAPGLSTLVYDLVGPETAVQGMIADPRDHSLPLAVDFINRLIQLRFERIRGRQLVRNASANTIDGIVGPKYRYLSNLDFYRQLTDAMRQYRHYEALLYGRYLVVRYVHPNKQYVVMAKSVADTYLLGLHFVNSEIGDSSVRAAPMICRERTGDMCIGPFAGRVAHAGRDFGRRFHELIETAEARLLSADEYRTKTLALLSASLGLGVDAKAEKRIRGDIVVTMVEKGLGVSIAEAVFHRALVHGAGGDEANEVLLDRQKVVLQRRTAYDIYAALIYEARPLAINARETAEQVAYAVLTGTITFGRKA